MSIQDLAKRKVILVDPSDNIIGETDLLDAHRGEGKLHRASSVFLFRKSPENLADNQKPKIQLLIQQRSQEKIVGADQWANTVCGNLRPGENYLECALRRLKEELGISHLSKADLKEIDRFQYQVKCNEEYSENEMDQVFAGWWETSGEGKQNNNLQENPAEVRQTRWVDWETVKTWEDPATVSEDLDLAPWFLIMLRPMLKNKNLIKKLDNFIKTIL